MEGECEGEGGERASHRNSAVSGVGLCGGGVEATLVGGVGGDPGAEEWFVFGVVGLNCVDDGTAVEVGEGGLHIDGEDGVVGVVVEECLGEFVEFLGAARAADGELVGSEGGGDGGSELFGDCGGDNSAENGTASDWADASVGFEEWDDTGGGECVEGGRVDSCGGEVGEDFGEGVEGVGVGGDDAVMLVTFAGGAGAAVFRSVGECAPNVSGNVFGHVGGDGGVGWFGDGWAVGVVLEELWELGLDLWFGRELWWALEDFEGLGVFVVVEAFHDGGNVLFVLLVWVVCLVSLSWLGVWLAWSYRRQGGGVGRIVRRICVGCWCVRFWRACCVLGGGVRLGVSWCC